VSTSSYDLIAELYDEDMGRSAPPGDLAFYGALARAAKGRVLELACGTGRVALSLAAAGAEVTGVDRSLPMLRELERKQALLPAAAKRVLTACLDLRSRALGGRRFALVLLPYSAITYLVDDGDRREVLRWVHGLLGPGGRFALDTFIPDPALDLVPDDHVFQDYRRALPDGRVLSRCKVIRKDRALRRNEIERRYTMEDAAGAVLRQTVTREIIRPFPPEELAAELAAAGLSVVERRDDFGLTVGERARTAVIVCTAVGPAPGAP
jgi:SAM-dependent methyltransferase